MGLWIWYATGTNEEIKQACEAGAAEIGRRGYEPREAFDAAMDAADLEEDFPADAPTPEGNALIAWFAGERAALERLAELTGVWPEQATLILTE